MEATVHSEPVLFNKEGPEPALIIHAGENLENLNLVQARNILGLLGVLPNTLVRLFRQEFEPIEGPRSVKIRSLERVALEAIVQRIAKVDDQLFEVDICKAYPAVTPIGKEPRILIHFKNTENVPGFEAFLVSKGEGEIFFPNKTVYDELTGEYRCTQEGKRVRVKKGDLAIIPAGTANNWSWVGDNFKFKYIAQPPYKDKIVKEVQYL